MTGALQRWSWLADEVNGRVTFGRPGVRDPDAICQAFEPVPGIDWLGMSRTAPGTGDCHSDGHYLCLGCSEHGPFDDDEDLGDEDASRVLGERGW